MSEDNSWRVRSNVAMNRNTPINTLDKLSKNKNTDVKLNIALNINTPIDVLKKLSEDEDIYVRELAINSLNNKGEM